MDYKKFIDEYQNIQEQYGNCERELDENYQKLTQDISEYLQDKSSQEYSEYFSELFEIWIVATKEIINIDILPFDDAMLDKKYKDYRAQTSIFPISSQDTLPIAASMNYHEPKDLTNVQKEKISKLLDFSYISHPDKLQKSKKIIEYILNELWLYIFKKELAFLSFKDDSGNNGKEKKYSEINTYFSKNWPLYELINQISKTINQISQEEKSQKIKTSSLNLLQKEALVADTEEICQHILETYILNKQSYSRWIPKLNNYEDIQLSHIIATSELVSYIFECKLMDGKQRRSYLGKVKMNVDHIYNNLISGNILYDAIKKYIDENDTEDIIIKYNNHLLSPRTVLVFIISVFQEVVRKSLIQSRNNIFNVILKKFRDEGITQKSIMSDIKKDAKAYMRIYNYLDEPTSATIKNKEKKLNIWLKELNKLRYGVLDDYLFDLAEAAQISFEEKTITSIKTLPKTK